MTDQIGRENVAARRAYRAEQPAEKQLDRPEVATAFRTTYPSSLLGDVRLKGQGNTSVHVSLMQGAQQTHGNRSVQRFLQQLGNSAPQVDENVGERIQARQGSGHPIERSVQRMLESNLGADLSGVRVHTDAEADQLSRSVQATAFTTGNDIFFRSGEYNPGTMEGLRLLTHEVTHTVQQSAGPVEGAPTEGGVSISDPSDSFEQEAERAATKVVSGAEGGAAHGGESNSDSAAHAGSVVSVQREEGEEDPARIAVGDAGESPDLTNTDAMGDREAAEAMLNGAEKLDPMVSQASKDAAWDRGMNEGNILDRFETRMRVLSVMMTGM